MLQGDEDWMRVAKAICAEDRIHATSYNARAQAAHRLRLPLGPVPCLGAVATAPVVLLLSHPPLDATASSSGYAFTRSGWPLAALHPDAPAELRATWSRRFASVVDRFGAQHVSNSLAVVFLTPWQCEQFDERLRLPSRQRMLDLAATAAARDAILVVAHATDLWTEHAEIASLPVSRRVNARSRRRADVTEENLGDAWDAVCTRIEVHAWLYPVEAKGVRRFGADRDSGVAPFASREKSGERARGGPSHARRQRHETTRAVRLPSQRRRFQVCLEATPR